MFNLLEKNSTVSEIQTGNNQTNQIPQVPQSNLIDQQKLQSNQIVKFPLRSNNNNPANNPALHANPFVIAKHNEYSHYSNIDSVETVKDLKEKGFKDPNGLKKILEYTGVGKDSYATVSKPAKRVHIVMSGPEVLEKFFAGGMSKFNPINLFNPHNKNLGAELYEKGDKLNLENPQNTKPHQSLEEIKAGLKSGRIKAVINYEIDEKTGKWNMNEPFAIDLLNNIGNAANDIKKSKFYNSLSSKEKSHFEPIIDQAANDQNLNKVYSLNLSLVNTGSSTKRYNQTQDEVMNAARALSEAMPHDHTLIIPSYINTDPNGNIQYFTSSLNRDMITLPNWQHLETDDKGHIAINEHPITISTGKGQPPVFNENFTMFYNLQRLEQLEPKGLKDKKSIEMVMNSAEHNKQISMAQ
ncbi:MAG: hypothetical protein MK033_12210 [Candidatus Caenarcaniphilales bacterium]|nr:hypothetical protein [Candidatus Caenarcaniphilales bacterium]